MTSYDSSFLTWYGYYSLIAVSALAAILSVGLFWRWARKEELSANTRKVLTGCYALIGATTLTLALLSRTTAIDALSDISVVVSLIGAMFIYWLLSLTHYSQNWLVGLLVTYGLAFATTGLIIFPEDYPVYLGWGLVGSTIFGAGFLIRRHQA